MAAKKKTEVVVDEMSCKVSDWDQYLFGQGNHYEIYKKLGAQKKMQKIGSMKVVNVCEAVMDVLEMTGFADILVIE